MRAPAKATRICCCWKGGKKSTMRFTVSVASMVCSVERTRWPVSAAASAACTVSESRISPTRITSGSCRIAARMAVMNESVSTPTSRWLTVASRSGCRTSMGSSMVRMCTGLVALMWSIIAARVVVLPEPVGPVTRIRPRGSSDSWRTTGGRPSSSNEGLPDADEPADEGVMPRWRKALTRNRPRPSTV